MLRMSEDFHRNVTFKQEWTEIETAGVIAMIQEYFSGGIRDVNDYFGLPYTSGGEFAAVWNTNKHYEIEEGIKLQGFVITTNNILLALGEDENETNYLYRVEH